MDCPYCQKTIEETTRVCPFCGGAVDLSRGADATPDALAESPEDQAKRKEQAEAAYRLAQKRREELSSPEGQAEMRRAVQRRRREVKSSNAIWPILFFLAFLAWRIISGMLK